MATKPDQATEQAVVFECGGSLYRVNGRVECLIGADWVPSQLSLDALLEAGARALDDDELARLRARDGGEL